MRGFTRSYSGSLWIVWPAGARRDVSPIAICLVFLLSLQVFCSSAQHQLPISPDSTSDPRCLRDCSNAKQKLLCGSDDRTYRSTCEIKRVRICLGRRVKTKHKGPCVADLAIQTTTPPSQTLSKCEAEKSSAEQQVRSSSTSGVYVAQCNEDGSYSSVQCHVSFGWCWCVNDEGRPLPGTAVRHQRPTCNQPVIVYPVDEPVFPTPTRPSKRGGCDQAARTKFNANLRRTFRQDYERSLSPAEVLELNSNNDAIIERQAMVQKFSDLDLNSDMYLQKKELATTRRLMKKVIKPKSCVKVFNEHCDLDFDGMVSSSEWLFCLGGVDDSDIFSFLHSIETSEVEATVDSTDSLEVNLPALVTRQVIRAEPSAAILPCHIEYQRATEEANRDSGIFIPECANNGLYHPVQCHHQAQYCWCAYVDTGRPIPGSSSTKPFNVECDPSATFRTPTARKEFRDCPDANKERFLTKLIAAIFERKSEADSQATQTVDQPAGDGVEMIRTILWEFHETDASRNGILEPPELDNFLRFVNTVRASKKCRRHFIEYCDYNSDDLISQREWLQCFEVDGVNSLPDSGPRGRNPFLDRLI